MSFEANPDSSKLMQLRFTCFSFYLISSLLRRSLINVMTCSSPIRYIIWNTFFFLRILAHYLRALWILTSSSHFCFITFFTWYICSISFYLSMSPWLYFWKFYNRFIFHDAFRFSYFFFFIWQNVHFKHWPIRYRSLSRFNSSYFFFWSKIFYEFLIYYFLS